MKDRLSSLNESPTLLLFWKNREELYVDAVLKPLELAPSAMLHIHDNDEDLDIAAKEKSKLEYEIPSAKTLRFLFLSLKSLIFPI